jgi:hypothetical protein
MHIHLVAEETSADVDLLTADDHNLLSGEDLLGDNGCKTTKEVALAINHDGSGGECRHILRVSLLKSISLRSASLSSLSLTSLTVLRFFGQAEFGLCYTVRRTPSIT